AKLVGAALRAVRAVAIARAWRVGRAAAARRRREQQREGTSHRSRSNQRARAPAKTKTAFPAHRASASDSSASIDRARRIGILPAPGGFMTIVSYARVGALCAICTIGLGS